jgi:hypothetical protein
MAVFAALIMVSSGWAGLARGGEDLDKLLNQVDRALGKKSNVDGASERAGSKPSRTRENLPVVQPTPTPDPTPAATPTPEAALRSEEMAQILRVESQAEKESIQRRSGVLHVELSGNQTRVDAGLKVLTQDDDTFSTQGVARLNGVGFSVATLMMSRATWGSLPLELACGLEANYAFGAPTIRRAGVVDETLSPNWNLAVIAPQCDLAQALGSGWMVGPRASVHGIGLRQDGAGVSDSATEVFVLGGGGVSLRWLASEGLALRVFGERLIPLADGATSFAATRAGLGIEWRTPGL